LPKRNPSSSRLVKRARLSYQEDRVNITETAAIAEITEITETTSTEAETVDIATAVTIMAVVNNNLHPRTIGEGHALVNSKSQRPDTMILKDKIVKRCRNHKTQRSCTSIRKRLTISRLPI